MEIFNFGKIEMVCKQGIVSMAWHTELVIIEKYGMQYRVEHIIKDTGIKLYHYYVDKISHMAFDTIVQRIDMSDMENIIMKLREYIG